MSRDSGNDEGRKRKAGRTDATLLPEEMGVFREEQARQMLDLRRSERGVIEDEPETSVEEGLPYSPPLEDPYRPPTDRELQEEPAGGDPAFDAGTDPDDYIEQMLRFRLERDDRVDAEGIRVTSRHGTVSLTGRVGSLEEAGEAEQIAAETQGVREVINRLEW